MADRPPRPRTLRLGILAAALAACQGTQTADTGRAVASGGYDQVMSGVSTTLSTDSAHQVHVVAESAFVRQQARELHFRRVGVTLFDRKGAPTGVVSGERGVYSLGKGVLDLRGKVVLITLAGDSLTTTHLIYDQRALKLHSDTSYAYSTRAGLFRGTGFTSDLGLRGITEGRRPDPRP